MFPVPHRWSTITSLVCTPGGALRASQVPGESSRTSALLLDPGRATLPLSPQQDGVAPADQTTKATAIMTISRLNHTASVLAVYASRFGFPYTGKTRFRWVTALTGWVSNPLDSDGEFQVGFASLSIPTPQASPGATDLCLFPMLLVGGISPIRLQGGSWKYRPRPLLSRVCSARSDKTRYPFH